MAQVLGLGLSHFGGFLFPDEDMTSRLKAALKKDSIPAALKDPANWPDQMRSEWGDDQGLASSIRHRAEYFAGLTAIRKALDSFNPDAVIIFGDDQYECFREDLIPPFCVFIMDEYRSKPYLRARGIGKPRLNIWNDPFDTTFATPGAPDIAKHLVKNLLSQDFDLAYGYTLPHQEYLGHAFTNTLMFLDHERRGWDYPVIPFAINSYGSALIRERGGLEGASDGGNASAEADPPAPGPKRCFELGAAIARAFASTPWRIALVATASFSHAFLTAKTHRLYPDLEADRVRFEELRSADYTAWRDLPLSALEDSGQHELLNWYPMVGAMHALGQKPSYCKLLESYVANSNKCVAIIPPER